MVFNVKKECLEETSEYGVLSNVGHLDWRFIKDGCEEIIYGLSEYGKPPVLIYPKP